MNRIASSLVVAVSLLASSAVQAQQGSNTTTVADSRVPAASPTTSPTTAATSPSQIQTTAPVVSPTRPERSGGFVWSIEGGVGMGSFDVGDVTVYLGPFAHLSLFLGGEIGRLSNGAGFALGYMAVVDSDSSGTAQRHLFAVLGANDLLFASLGLGPGAIVPFDGSGVSPTVAVTVAAGFRFGDSGFFLSFPFGADFVIGGVPIKSMSLTLGFESL